MLHTLHIPEDMLTLLLMFHEAAALISAGSPPSQHSPLSADTAARIQESVDGVNISNNPRKTRSQNLAIQTTKQGLCTAEC
jgi:hypothetical protein